MRSSRIDKVFLGSFALLLAAGFLIFLSASLGLIVRDGNIFSQVAVKQGVIGLVVGIIAVYIVSKIPVNFWKKYAFPIGFIGIILAALVFVPHLGVSHGGARRWLSVGPLSFQPSEFLKLGLIIYFAAWLSHRKDKIHNIKNGLIPFLCLILLAALLILKEPDTGTFLVIAISLFAMYFAAGAPWRDFFIFLILGIVGITSLFFVRPYIRERLLTFFDPSRDPQGAGYQIQQSQIAIGSGQWNGRGFGQSIQKFNYLPEPVGDSIFAVAAEEFGFIGSALFILLYCLFALRGLHIANHNRDSFSRLLCIGIVILILSQSFINMGSMLGVLPLTGIPLIFASHGGTALLIAMIEVGIVLQISKHSN